MARDVIRCVLGSGVGQASDQKVQANAVVWRRRRARCHGPWFAEGFDTADLQEAKALLEELA
jgi:hypothetical protein